MFLWLFSVVVATTLATKSCILPKEWMACPVPDNFRGNFTGCNKNTVACPAIDHSCIAFVDDKKLIDGGCLRNKDNRHAVLENDTGTFHYGETFFSWDNPCRSTRKKSEYTIEYIHVTKGMVKICCNRSCTVKNPMEWGTDKTKWVPIFVGVMIAIFVCIITISGIYEKYKKYQAKCLVLRNMKFR